MKSLDKNYRVESLSPAVLTALAFYYLSIMACLTVLTNAAQIFGLTFRIYAYLSLIIAAIITLFFLQYVFRYFGKNFQKDYLNLLGILALCIFCAVLSVGYHRIGRVGPDEFYYAASPVYYLSHPDEPMGFQLHTFYSRVPFYSVAYLTAGAYEYILAVLSFFLKIRFATTYYLIGASITGFLIPASFFLLIHWFSGTSKGALFGGFVVVCAIMMMGEKFWTPGPYSFMRAFEGKSFLLFAGLALFAYFSLLFFRTRSPDGFLKLLALTTALAGMTTTSLPVVLLLGGILFLSYWLSSFRDHPFIKDILRSGLVYILSCSYLIFWGIYILFFDDLSAALWFNRGYSFPFLGYVSGFIYDPFPTTAILFVSFSIFACLLARGRKATILILWMGLSIVLVLNPLVAPLYLNYFSGIYFRFFYIFPFPLVAGLAAAFALSTVEQRFPQYHKLFPVFVALIALVFALILPTSIARMENYAPGNVLQDRALVRANALTQYAPRGVMLAPYPLSGAVQMLDGGYPQIINRGDIIFYYLSIKSQSDDARLRVRAGDFLSGDSDDPAALFDLLSIYPEIRSVVVYLQVYTQFRPQILRPLRDLGFEPYETSGLVIFSR
jgi:hypothetical protein